MINLQDKLTKYLELKASYATVSHENEINAKVEEFRQKLISEYKAQDAADIEKINHYIELLMELIEESAELINDETITNDAVCSVADHSQHFTNSIDT